MQNCVENVYVTNKGSGISMNTFIFLGCVPVPGWQQKIDFVTKAVLDKQNTYILVRKQPKKTPPSKDAT